MVAEQRLACDEGSPEGRREGQIPGLVLQLGVLLLIEAEDRGDTGDKLLVARLTIAQGPARQITGNGTVKALREHRARQLDERLDWGAAYQDRGLVFCREEGTPIWPRTFSRSFDHHVRDARLPKIRLHDLRHTHATLALEAGVHPKVVQERLGHATIAITLDTYSHAIPAIQEDAATKIAALLDG